MGGGGGVFEIGNPEGKGGGVLKQFWKSIRGVCGFFLE